MSEPFYSFIGFFYVAACTLYGTVSLSIFLFWKLADWMKTHIDVKD